MALGLQLADCWPPLQGMLAASHEREQERQVQLSDL
jgi:hypothetical protein